MGQEVSGVALFHAKKTIGIYFLSFASSHLFPSPCHPQLSRQCVCLFRDPRTVDRFCVLIQHLTRFCVQQLKNLRQVLEKAKKREQGEEEQEDEEEKEKEDEEEEEEERPEEAWSALDTEMLLQFVAKLFIQMFPLYLGPKQVGWSSFPVQTTE